MTTAETKMIYRNLGRTGLKVSALSYGAWVTFGNQLDVDQATEVMKAAWDAGVNFFDNAETYAAGKAEELMGEAFKKLGWKREDFVVSTKIFFGAGNSSPNAKGLSRKHLIEGTRAALKRLQLDYVDLVFAHRPDPSVPMEEVVRAFNWIIDQGWAFYWGTSEWSAEQLEEAWAIADRLGLIGPAMEQPQYNILHRQKVDRDFVPLYKERGLGLTIWSPLASGVLTGKYSGGAVPEGSRMSLKDYAWLKERTTQERLAAVDRLQPIADEIGCSLSQFALAWCVANPHVSTVITGSTKLEQLHENMKAIEFVDKITDDIKKKVDDIIGALAFEEQ